MIIRKLKDEDIEQVVKLHLKSLSGTISSRIGKDYLKKTYVLFTSKDKIHKGYVASIDSKIIGVATATTDLKNTQTELKNLYFPKVYLVILYSLLKRKITAKDLLKRLFFEYKLLKKFEKPYLAILTIFVEKNYRRKKIGKKLLKKLLLETKKEKSVIYVDTLINNYPAQNFYKSMGFVKVNKIQESFLYKKLLKN